MGNIPVSGGGGGAAVWGSITGTLSNQLDLASALGAKATASFAAPYLTVNGSVTGPNFALTLPPAIGSWTWVNQNGATANTTNGFLNLIGPLTTGDNFNLLVLTAPATPWTKTAYVNFYYFSAVGLVFRESGGTKFVIYGFADSSGATTMAAIKYNSPTSFSAVYKQALPHFFNTSGIWLRVADNGTNRICSFSLDGVNFVQFHSVGRTDFLTADQVGVFINAGNGTDNSVLNVLSWA